MNRIAYALTMACAGALLGSGAHARDITIASWGGNYQDAQRQAYFIPFAEAQGLEFNETTYLGGLAEISAMVDTNNVTWDIVIGGGYEMMVGCDLGLFEFVDWDTVGSDNLLPQAVQDCAVGNVVIGNGLAYNTRTVPEPPKNWADFFDRDKIPGKRGLRNTPVMNLEYALMGAGVPPEEVYDVLSTPDGVDLAFAQWDKIKDLLQFWDAGSQPVEWLLAENVALSTSFNGRIITAKNDGQPLEFVWDNHLVNIDSWAVVAGSPYAEEAVEFFKIANDAERQAEFSRLMPYGPTNVLAAENIDPEILEGLPAGENIETALFMDDGFWVENLDHLNERWNAWATR